MALPPPAPPDHRFPPLPGMENHPSTVASPPTPVSTIPGTFVFANGASFRDKVIAGKADTPGRLTDDSAYEDMVKLDFLEGDRLKPRITIDPRMKERLYKPYEDGLIISVLGKKVGYVALLERISTLWKMHNRFGMVDMGAGYFMVKFDNLEDRLKVLNEGPWVVFDSYLLVCPWRPNFVADEETPKKTVVWARFPGLSFEFYDEILLRRMAAAIGKLVRIDAMTKGNNRGKFARVCVEIDLNLPVVSSVLIGDRWQKVAYEGLHFLCTKCHRYGHGSQACMHTPAVVPEEAPVKYG